MGEIKAQLHSCLNWELDEGEYNRTTFIRINWEEEPSGYVEKPENWNFL
jgi:hypothetical protein